MVTSSNGDSFGGMERAFSAKTMMRHDKYFRYSKDVATADLWKEPPQTTDKDKKRKKLRRNKDSPCGLWASLHDNLLHMILMKLNIIDYFAVGAVCRTWRSVAKSSTDVYMEQQKPLVIVRSKWAKRTCFLYNIFEGEVYKTLLPDMRNKIFVGLSCGYLITLDDYKYNFRLINLMTKHELRYPALPHDIRYYTGYYNVSSILFKSTRSSQISMIVFLKGFHRLLITQKGADTWRVYTISNAYRGIADVKVFKKKIYVVTVDARICVFDFSTSPVMRFYDGNISTGKTKCTHLVIMENQLCIRATHNTTLNILYELNDEDMVWVKRKKELGKYSLFVDWANATMVDSSNWGAGNYICALNSNVSDKWSLRRLNHAKKPTYAPVIWSGDPKLVVWFWYFPDKSYDIDLVDD